MRGDDMDRLRVPPHSIEAEQAVLGGIMLAGESAWERVAYSLTSADFYHRAHAAVWEALADMAAAKRPLDAVTVGSWLDAQGLGELTGGGAYMVDLASSTPSAANIAGYAQIVAEAAWRRRYIAAGTDMVAAGFATDGREREELLGDAQNHLAGLQLTDAGGMTRVAAAMPSWWEGFSTRYQAGAQLIGLATPWADYNAATGGLIPQELTILAGRPSMGKSVAGFGMANHAAVNLERKVGVFSLETAKAAYINRMVAARARVPFAFVRAPSQDADDGYLDRMALALRDIKRAPLFIDDTPGITARQFEARARALHRREGLDLLVVDHIHEFSIDAKLARFEFGAIAAAGSRLAKELNIPVVMLAQLNRMVGQRSDKRPQMSDLRESGEIEQKADVIAFIHREDYYDRETHMKGIVEIEFAKGRDIEAGKRIYLRNRYDQMRLEDRDGDALPAAPQADRPAPRSSGPRFGQRRRAAAVGEE